MQTPCAFANGRGRRVVLRVAPNRDRQILALAVAAATGSVPWTYDGCAYERVGNTTRRMSRVSV
jgi:hypothetical protein